MVCRDAYPSPLNYHHFPKSVCTSVNEVRDSASTNWPHCVHMLYLPMCPMLLYLGKIDLLPVTAVPMLCVLDVP